MPERIPPHRPAPRVLVVGAGIVGAACAYYLCRRGASVTVLERADQPAGGSTGRSAAGIRHQFSHPTNVALSRFSSAEFDRFVELTGVGAGYRRIGYLFLVPPAMKASWSAQARMQRQQGAVVETLDLEELAGRFPHASTVGLAAATFGPDDGIIDPHAVTLGFLQAARSAGAETVFGAEMLSASRLGGVWRLETRAGRFEADAVVNAAGPQAGAVAARAGLDVPVRPVRRNVYATAPLAEVEHPLPLTVDLATGVYLRSEGERVIFGLSNPAEPEGENLAVDWEWLDHLLELALPRFPFLANASLDRHACWAGLYEVTPDHMPVLGGMPHAPGFYNACGFSGHGVQHAPAAGLLTAEEVLDGEAHSFDIRDFRIERFAAAAASAPPPERNIV